MKLTAPTIKVAAMAATKKISTKTSSYTPQTTVFHTQTGEHMILEAQNNICGYVDGLSVGAYACLNTSDICAFSYPKTINPYDAALSDFLTGDDTSTPISTTLTSAPTPTSPSILCCNPALNNCEAQPTACVDAYEHPYTDLCTGSCPADPMTLKCTSGINLHCNRFSFVAPLTPELAATNTATETEFRGPAGWFCDVTPVPLSRVVFTTYPTAVTATMATTTTVTVTEGGGGVAAPVPTDGYYQDGNYDATWTEYYPDAVETATSSNPDLSGGDEYYYADDDEYGEYDITYYKRNGDPSSHNRGVKDDSGVLTITEGVMPVETTYTGQTDGYPFTEAAQSDWVVLVPIAPPTPTSSSATATGTDDVKKPSGARNKEPSGTQKVGLIIGATVAGIAALLLVYGAYKWYKTWKQRKATAIMFSKGRAPGVY